MRHRSSACSQVRLTERAAERPFRPDVTVATIVCHAQRFLVVEEQVRGQRVINQPAGHLEADETLVAAAARETLEETGWDVDIEAYLGTYQWTAPSGEAFLRFAFIGVPRTHHPARPLDAGIEQVLWLPRDELAAQRERLRSPLVLCTVDDYIAGVRHPLDALRWVAT